MFLKISTNNESEIIGLLGAKGVVNDFKKIRVSNLDFLMKYGSKEYELPFKIKLNDFIARPF